MATEHQGLTGLRALLERIDDLKAPALAESIRSALAAGIVRRERESRRSPELRDGARGRLRRRGVNEEPSVQEAFLPDEAFVVAVRLVVAALDPLFMMDETSSFLRKLTGTHTDLRWEPDHLEGSDLDGITERRAVENVMPLPRLSVDELKVLREEILEIRRLCDELFKESA